MVESCYFCSWGSFPTIPCLHVYILSVFISIFFSKQLTLQKSYPESFPKVSDESILRTSTLSGLQLKGWLK